MLNRVKNLIATDPVLWAGTVAALMLGTAFTFQLFGYPPCDLCWWQRYPYMAIMGISLVGTAIKAISRLWLLVVLALLFAVDAGIAGFHVGVEQRWWEGLSTCSSYVDFSDGVDAAMKAIMDAPLIRCDEIAWSLFGISMAGYNMLGAVAMTLYCALKAKAARHPDGTA